MTNQQKIEALQNEVEMGKRMCGQLMAEIGLRNEGQLIVRAQLNELLSALFSACNYIETLGGTCAGYRQLIAKVKGDAP